MSGFAQQIAAGVAARVNVQPSPGLSSVLPEATRLIEVRNIT
jgi:hypothetical protein